MFTLSACSSSDNDETISVTDDTVDQVTGVEVQGISVTLNESQEIPTPIGVPAGASGDAPGPIGPGGAYEFLVQAVDGDKLSFVTMFIPSNDWFYTPTDADNSIDLFVSGQPVTGEIAEGDIAIWDAGTEVDEEPGSGPNQVQRQESPNTGPSDPDTSVASLTARGQSGQFEWSCLASNTTTSTLIY